MALRLFNDARINSEEDSLGESRDNNGDMARPARIGGI